VKDNDKIWPIAAFIGSRLNHIRPRSNAGHSAFVSTIRVDQYKEKFWYARIYCELAAPELVKAKWNEHKEGEPTPEFVAKCLLHDARHYRKCYLDMVELAPDLRGKICAQADYPELLAESLDKIAESNSFEGKFMSSGELHRWLIQVYDEHAF